MRRSWVALVVGVAIGVAGTLLVPVFYQRSIALWRAGVGMSFTREIQVQPADAQLYVNGELVGPERAAWAFSFTDVDRHYVQCVRAGYYPTMLVLDRQAMLEFVDYDMQVEITMRSR